MPLEKDNPSHRAISIKLDDSLSGKGWYDKAVRPIVHGTYHACRALPKIDIEKHGEDLLPTVTINNNKEEWARAKDQYSKVGTGQSQTEYLKIYRDNKVEPK